MLGCENAWRVVLLQTAPNHVYEGISRVTFYEACRWRQKERGTVAEHTEKRMDMAVLHNESETVYVSNLIMLSRSLEAGRHPRDWLGHCVLPWPHHTLPFLGWGEVGV